MNEVYNQKLKIWLQIPFIKTAFSEDPMSDFYLEKQAGVVEQVGFTGPSGPDGPPRLGESEETSSSESKPESNPQPIREDSKKKVGFNLDHSGSSEESKSAKITSPEQWFQFTVSVLALLFVVVSSKFNAFAQSSLLSLETLKSFLHG